MLSEKQVAEMAVHENCLLKDFDNACNYVGIEVQKGKIEILDRILEIKK